MAIIDLTGTAFFPLIRKIAGVGTVQQEITLPPGKLKISVGATVIIDIATSSVADGAAMPSDKAFVPANNLLPLSLGHSGGDRIDKFAVAAQAGTADIVVILERI